MSNVEVAYDVLYTGVMICFAILIMFALLRAVIGPKIADRLMAINMIGTMTIIMMAIVALKLNEDYLLDISIIYAMISFLSVVILTKVYIGVHEENSLKKAKYAGAKRLSDGKDSSGENEADMSKEKNEAGEIPSLEEMMVKEEA